MRIFTQSLRSIMMLAVMLLTTTVAMAEPDDAYHWYYDVFEAYPTGAGKVYIESQSAGTTESSDQVPAASWQERFEWKSEVFGMATDYLNGFVQPAEGWTFIGWGTKDEVIEPASLYSDIYMLMVNSKTSATDNTVDLTPFEPDTTIYALFTHISASVDESCSLFGSVEVSPLVNKIGDKVTLKAVADEAYQATFDYWLAPDGETQLKDAELQVDVTEAAHYTAFFHSDAVETIPASESGYQIIYDTRNLQLIGDNASIFFVDTYNIGKSQLTYTTDSKMIWGLTPTIVCSWGDIQVLPLTDDVWPADNPFWTGDEAQAVGDLDGTKTYYQVVLPTGDEWQVKLTRLAADATIPAKTMVFGFDNESIQEIGGMDDVLTLEMYDGIHSVSAVKTANSRIYDLNGRLVRNMNRKGMYIVDGKKVVIRR